MKPSSEESKTSQLLEEFVRVVHRLRTECPWDRVQTHATLAPYVVEEAYEAADAMRLGPQASLVDELGDLLLQVVLHSEIGSETSTGFTLDEVIQGITAKMIRRHPHVFQEGGMTEKSLERQWSKIKKSEKAPSADTSQMRGLVRTLPALQLIQKIGDRAGEIGFDWSGPSAVLVKVEEEVRELQEAIEESSRSGDVSKLRAELGDVFFALTQLARHLDLNADIVAREGAEKFERRFRKMEQLAREAGKDLETLDIDEQHVYWKKAKQLEG